MLAIACARTETIEFEQIKIFIETEVFPWKKGKNRIINKINTFFNNHQKFEASV